MFIAHSFGHWSFPLAKCCGNWNALLRNMVQLFYTTCWKVIANSALQNSSSSCWCTNHADAPILYNEDFQSISLGFPMLVCCDRCLQAKSAFRHCNVLWYPCHLCSCAVNQTLIQINLQPDSSGLCSCQHQQQVTCCAPSFRASTKSFPPVILLTIPAIWFGKVELHNKERYQILWWVQKYSKQFWGPVKKSMNIYALKCIVVHLLTMLLKLNSTNVFTRLKQPTWLASCKSRDLVGRN